MMFSGDEDYGDEITSGIFDYDASYALAHPERCDWCDERACHGECREKEEMARAFSRALALSATEERTEAEPRGRAIDTSGEVQPGSEDYEAIWDDQRIPLLDEEEDEC
jgi:hypothetical protein